MRHRKSGRKLGRTASHRKATLSNLSAALFERKHIKTTEAKAKETRRISERLITLAKKQTVHARRLALRTLRQKDVVKILFDEIAPRYAERPGGYTRVIKLGQRPGDGAHMAVLELVGYEMAKKKKKDKEAKVETKKKSEKKKGVGKAEETPAVTETSEQEKKKKKSKPKDADVEQPRPEKEKKEKKEKKKKSKTSDKKKDK